MAIKFLNTVAVDTDVLYVDAANNRVGIGTASPSYKLHIAQGEIGISNLAPGFTNPMGVIGAYNLDANNGGLLFKTINASTVSERMRITAAGNVGIGTTTPGAKLHILSSNTSSFDQVVKLSGQVGVGGGPAVFFKTSGADNDNRYGVKLGAVRSDSDNGSSVFKIQQELSNTAGVLIGLTDTFTINQYGNVGIGTTSPSVKLEVLGQDVEFYSGTGSQSLQVGRNGSERLETYVNDNTIKLTAYQDSDGDGSHNFILNRIFLGTGSNDFQIQKDGSTQLIVNSIGNVGIGTTSPQAKLTTSGVIMAINSDAAYNAGYFASMFSDYGPNALKLTSRTGDVFLASDYGSSVTLQVGNPNVPALYINANKRVQFNGYDSTNQTGTPTYILGTDASGNVVKVLGSNIPTTAPATPSTITSTIVGETIEIAFNQSSTSNIDYYQVWSSDDGGDYGIIAQITPADFSSTMTVVDTTFVTGGTMSYRVFAVRGGIYSTAGTTSKAYTVGALSVTDMTVVNLNTAYYIQYEKPTSRFIDHVEIYMDSQTTSAALSRSNATIVYSGQNASYMRNVNTSSNFHQFWVEIVTS